MQATLSSKNYIIVTGANKGIGYAVVERLLNANTSYDILLTSRDTRRGTEALETLHNQYPKLKKQLDYHQLDVTSEESINNFVKFLSDNKHSVQILVNNAGFADWKDVMDPDYWPSQDEIKYLLDINVFGLINVTNAILPLLTKDGRVINVSSSVGALSYQGEIGKKIFEDPNWNIEKIVNFTKNLQEIYNEKKQVESGFSKSIYCVSKAIVNAYTRFALVKELKDDQSCFTIHPGWVQTDLGGPKAPLSKEEGTVSILTCVNFTQKEAKDNNGLFFEQDGTIKAW